jgi:hypothetical protein
MGRNADRLWLGILVCLVACQGCGKEERDFGQPVPQEATITLADLVRDVEPHLDKPVVVQARIESVCQSRGCWCILRDGGDRLHVSMTAFTLPPDVSGRMCRVEGRLAMRNDRPTLLASGVNLLPD